MKIKSYSKINLSLRILKKLKNGMHNIETNSTLVNLSDKIIIKNNNKDKIIFKGKFKNKVNSKDNSIKTTLNVLRRLNLIKKFYRITVEKNIPVYAGLGGGTSNSASIVKYFLNNNLNESLISIFEKKVGSDFRLFLNNCSFQNKLGKVYKTKNKILFPIVIVFPYIYCKTKNIYKLNKSFSTPSENFYSRKISQKTFIEMIKKDKNDLQKIAEKKYSKIYFLIKSLNNQEGCIFSRMTGSGSACYGVFKSKETAKLALNNLKRKYPKYWCAITKTI